MLVVGGLVSTMSLEQRVRNNCRVLAVLTLLVGLYFFETSLIFLCMILSILVCKLYCILHERRLGGVDEGEELSKLRGELQNTITSNTMLRVRLEEINNLLDSDYSEVGSYKRDLARVLNWAYDVAMNQTDVSELKPLIDDLIVVLREPPILHGDKHIDMFDNLTTKRDKIRGAKVLARFRRRFSLGRGFDSELDYYIRTLLKEVER